MTAHRKNDATDGGARPGGPRPARHRLARILIPAVLVLVWVALAGVGGPYFGRIGEVSSNDPAAYLPSDAVSTRVQEARADFQDGDQIPAIIVAASDDGQELTKDQLARLQQEIDAAVGRIDPAGGASPAIPSQDGQAVQVFVPLDQDGEPAADVASLRADLAQAVDGANVHVTGPAGFSADLEDAFAGIDGLLLLVAFAAVLVILVVVYRAVLLPLLVLASSLFALCAAVLVNWQLAKAGLFMLNGQVQGILFILVIGAATDYGLLLTVRYREELTRTTDRIAALRSAWRGSLEPIIASGGTVIVGLLCLLLSQLESNRALGPVAAVGIVCAMLAALTFLPALLALTGRAAYWPRVPRTASTGEPGRAAEPAAGEQTHRAAVAPAGHGEPTTDEVIAAHGVYGRIGSFTARHPFRVWIGALLLLAAACAFVPQLKADGVAQSDLVLTASDARDGQAILADHFPGGSGSPALLLAPEGDAEAIAQKALEVEGVDSVAAVANEDPKGQAQFRDGVFVGAAPQAPAPALTVADGKALLQATLADPYDSSAAERTVERLREKLGEEVLVGGPTAVDVDTNDASKRDRTLIIPVVLAVITVILMLLMRSIVAGIMLISTTVLSFGSAMGVSALVFDHLFEFPGADPSVPLYGFVFLVALGIDYNIFLMTRVREEALRYGTREGFVRGVALTGGVITSAGIVLAATFAALYVIPILFLAQLAFIVAFGVLLDTFVVRTLLVPGLGVSLGRSLWWPLRLAADRPERGAHRG